MTRTRAFGLILFVLLVAAAGIVLVVVGPQWYGADQSSGRAAATATEQVATRRIRATLFFVSEDGARLVPIEREVPYGDGLLEQARRIVEAEIGPAPAPLLSALPAGTKLRAVYVSEQGEAFVDFSRELVAAHPGGSLNELLTVYSVVDALTANLPAVHAVQLLVDGREVDTLAGHVDLRRPLGKSKRWVQETPRQ
jgi:spore germination protein GerM